MAFSANALSQRSEQKLLQPAVDSLSKNDVVQLGQERGSRPVRSLARSVR
jgi:hypothetical protein